MPSASRCCTHPIHSATNERAAMPVASPQENLVRVSTTQGETVTLTIDAGAPVTIQLEVGGQCNCGGSARVAGAYTNTDFGTH